jgi:hypothetical protein
MKLSRIFAAASLAIAALGASGSSSQANVRYTVENATFDDGTSLTGYFILNQYDQLASWDLTTVTGTNGTGTVAGFEYTPSTTFLSGGCVTSPCFVFGRAPTYFGSLQLAFVNTLPLFGTDPFDLNNSWETYSFGSPGVPVRFLQSGDVVASIPEPATWAMMVIGFAGLGFAGYRTTQAARLAQVVV